MHTSLIVFALLGPGENLTTSASRTPTWQDSYGAAREAGRQEGKPLAVFIGSGPTGWKKVVRENNLSDNALQVLMEGYVCLYVDRTQPGSSRLAESFEVPDGPGLVLSSRDGEGQAFYHAGRLRSGDLEERLVKYSGVEKITYTETIVDPRVSFAYNPTPPSRPASAPPIAPAMHAYPSQGFGGSPFGGYSGGFSGATGGSGGC